MYKVFGTQCEDKESGVPSPRAWWTSVALLLGALTIPVFAAQVPPLTDYPNHLARCYVLAFGNTDPILSRMFSHTGKLFLILPSTCCYRRCDPSVSHSRRRVCGDLSFALPTSGTIAFSCALFRRRSFWQLTAGFAAFNVLFLMGFMNFTLSIGVALWAAAAWIHFRERDPWLAVAIGTLVATPTFFFHIMGLFFYALLVACYEVFAIGDHGIRTSAERVNALKRIGMAAIPLIIPFILYLNSPLENAGGAVEWTSLRRKAYSLPIPFLGYSLAIDLLVIAPIVGFLIYCLYSKKAWISRPLALCFCVLLINYAILPQTIKGGFWVDSRMMAMLGFVIFAGFVPRGLTARQEAVLASVICGVIPGQSRIHCGCVAKLTARCEFGARSRFTG